MGIGSLEKILQHLKVEHFIKITHFDIFSKITHKGIRSSGSIKTKKSPSAHVLDCKIRLECRVMLPFVSADRYDPKKACKYTCWVLDTNRTFFGDPQSQVSYPSKSNFLGGFEMMYTIFALEGVSKLKNHHQLTFGIVKSDWSVV